MAKYEIMLVVDGRIEKAKAESTAKELINIIKSANGLKEINHGLKTMAYQINKTNQGYYFQYNFETTNSNEINEFRRLTLINKAILRHLIINLEKDYGYKATINPKKIKRSENKLKNYEERQAKKNLAMQQQEGSNNE